MAADFWASSHYKRWIVDRATVRRARTLDLLYVDDPVYLDYFAIYFANVITKLGKKLGLRQRVIATATVFFRRFYLKNAYCETDPFLVIAACCYVAAKAEESPVHIKTVISEARSLFSQDMYSIKNFPTDNSKLAEMEFYLADDLECDLTVFHPYRTLLTLCKKESELDSSTTPAEEGEAGEVGSAAGLSGNGYSSGSLGVGIGADDGPRYWGTGEGKLELSTGALQTAWFIINDTYRSDICLLYPPHLIAISAVYLTFILHNPTRSLITPLLSSSSSSPSPSPTTTTTTTNEEQQQKPRRSTRNTTSPHHQQPSSSSSSTTTTEKKPYQDPITFLSELNVSLPLISTISQEIISLYTLWDRYKEDAHPEAKTPSLSHTYLHTQTHHPQSHSQSHSYHGYTSLALPPPQPTTMPISNTFPNTTLLSMPMPISMSLPTPGNSNSTGDTPNTDINSLRGGGGGGGGGVDDGTDDMTQGSKDGNADGVSNIVVTITPLFLSGLLLRMRELRVLDVAQQGQRNVGVGGGGVNVGTGINVGAGSGVGYVHAVHGVHGVLTHGVHSAHVHGHGQGSVIHGYGQVHGMTGMTGGMTGGMVGGIAGGSGGMRIQQIQGRGSVAVNKMLERTQAAG